MNRVQAIGMLGRKHVKDAHGTLTRDRLYTTIDSMTEGRARDCEWCQIKKSHTLSNHVESILNSLGYNFH